MNPYGPFDLRYKSVTCNSCNMGTRDLPDIYARGLQARGLRAYISGKSREHMLQVIRMYHFHALLMHTTVCFILYKKHILHRASYTI